MRVAVVVDKSGTIVKAYRVLCDVRTGECFTCDSTLRYVAEGGEALVNVTGALESMRKGDIQRVGLKVSCAPNRTFKVGKEVLTQPKVMEAINRAVDKVDADCGRGLGICAAILVDPQGMVTHAVALGGALYEDAQRAVAAIKTMGDDVFLATGNCRESSMRCAKLLGIPEGFVLCDADPLEKRDLVRRLKSYYGAVVMVGNDINDMEAMGEAEVGVLIKRDDSRSAKGLEGRWEVDFVLDSLDGVVGIVQRLKEPLPHNTGHGNQGACGGGRRRSRPLAS